MNVNYKIGSSDDVEHGHYSSVEKCIKYIDDRLKRVDAEEISDLLEPSDNKYYLRKEYTSNYGKYPCAFEIREIQVN